MPVAPGDRIWIPVEAAAGAFPGESLITIETIRGPVSGFTNNRNLHRIGDRQYIRAEVQEVSEDTVTVILRGSFFTTTGVAYLPRGSESEFRKAS